MWPTKLDLCDQFHSKNYRNTTEISNTNFCFGFSEIIALGNTAQGRHRRKVLSLLLVLYKILKYSERNNGFILKSFTHGGNILLYCFRSETWHS